MCALCCQPVSAAIIPASKKASASPSAPAMPTSQVDQPPVTTSPPRRSIFGRIGRHADASSGSVLPLTALPPPPTPVTPSTAASPYSPEAGATSTPDSENLDKLQLTVLIAMPNANARQYVPPSATGETPASSSNLSLPTEVQKRKATPMITTMTRKRFGGGVWIDGGLMGRGPRLEAWTDSQCWAKVEEDGVPKSPELVRRRGRRTS